MLSSLIVLGALLGSKSVGSAQNPQFPKPNLDIPSALQDTTIFKYLGADDKQRQWKPLEVGRDWSNLSVPDIKPDALKLRVLLTVAERDFSNPEFSNTLEMRDKTRLLEAMARLKSLFAIVSDGSINMEFVPRFIEEPIFDIREFKEIINAEFNKSKFESDDSVERGPFGAVIAISSSHVNDQAAPGEDYAVHGFSDLGGSGQDMWFEEGLFYVIQSQIFGRLSNRFSGFKAGLTQQNTRTLLMDRLVSMRGEYQQFFDSNFRQDGDLLTKWTQQSFRAQGRAVRLPEMSAVQSPAEVAIVDGALNYRELSILRAGEVALPQSDKWGTQKALTFEVRSKNRNPIAIKLWLKNGSKKETIIGGEPGMIPFAADNNWQTLAISIPNQEVIGASIGAPTSYVGKTRLRSELTQCDFRNFDLVSDAPISPLAMPVAPQTFDTEEAIKAALTGSSKVTKRKALANIEAIKGLRGLESTLLAATGELDAGVAHDATKAYFEFMLARQPTPDQIASLSKFLLGPPSESAREIALLYVAKNPAYAKFDLVFGNTVRGSWRVRRSAQIALGALQRANVKEKEGCHQALLTSTGQEMALMRLVAISQLDPTQKLDSQRLEFLMVNDPCESVRLACLRALSSSSSISKEKLLGCLADESPSLRESIPATLGIKSPLLREVLQKLVVDQDPYVRASALQNFAILGSVKEGEIQNVFADKHPAVQMAVLQGAQKGSWTIPAEALNRLKESPIPSVKALAMEIK
jgi:HEAT repeat protein